MRSVAIIVSLLGFLAAANAGAGIGSTLVNNAFSKTVLPLSARDASSKGWKNMSSSCYWGRGMPMAMSAKGPTGTYPIILYFNPGGQLNGYSLRMYHPLSSVNRPFWDAPSTLGDCAGEPQCYDLVVMFREASKSCVRTNFAETLGDRVVVGTSQKMTLPLTGTDAKSKGWVQGNCIPSMGTHYNLDLKAPGRQTWNSSTLFYVTPMYDHDTGSINAILVSSPHLCKIWPLGPWEGPFPNPLFCKNWCANTGCTFSGTMIWSTSHFWFRDPHKIDCTGTKCKLL